MSNQATVCQGDIKVYCDDISSWECYESKVRYDCCQACEDNVYNPVVPGCEYGDHIEQCDVNNGRRCYNDDVRRDCCNTCQGYETSIPGCRYGDKTDYCKHNDCLSYSSQRRAECCLTCTNNLTTTVHGSSVTWSTQWHSITTGSTSDSPVTTVTSERTGVPAWTVPVAASVGGAIVLIVVLIVIVLYRRNRNHHSPITDKMYNDYKMSKRAPIAPPRHPSTEIGWGEGKEDISEYAYISPDYVEGPQVKDKRSGNDPLPPPPGEYLDLSGAKSVSYGYSPSANLRHEGLNKERVPSNKYEQWPGSQTYVNQAENENVSEKL